MKTLLLPLFFFLVFNVTSFGQGAGQNARIKGIVLDSANNLPIPFVTIAIREAGKTGSEKAGYSAENGSFEIAGLQVKTYEAVFSFMGYSPKIVPVPAFAGPNQVADLGRIYLVPTSQQLKAVEVTAEKLLIKQDIDKLTYEVEADPESKTLTALEMLRKVPLVTIDGEDNIQLKGSGNYRVLVNGKSSALFIQNPSEVFKSMPASTIKSIEVITEPSAKYDAEGVGGIINIITVKQSLAGYNGSVSVGGGLPENYNISGFGTIKAGKFGMAVNFGNSEYTRPEAKNILFRRDSRNQGSELRQNGSNISDGYWRNFNAQISFEIDSLNLLTAEIGMNGSSYNSDLNQVVGLYSGSGNLVQAYNRNNRTQGGWHGNSLGLDYQKSFAGKPDQLFTLSYKRNAHGSENLTDFTVRPIVNFEGINARSNNDAGTVEHTAQADYVQPVGKHTVEAGLKTIIRLSDSDFFYANINPGNGALVKDPTRSNNFDYRQDIYAAYSSASFRKDKWGLKVGVRLEETRIDAEFSSADTVASQHYLNLIPSVALSRKLGQMDAIKLSYNQRMERPGLWSLNPFPDLTDPRNISYGNPELRPVISHNVDLSYNTFIKGSAVSGSLYQSFTNNSVQRFTVLGPDSVSRSTFANIGQSRVIGVSVFGNTTLFKKLSVRTNVSVNYNRLSSTDNTFARRNDGFMSNYSAGLSYRLGKTWRLSANGGGSSRRVTLQGTANAWYYHSLSVSKSYLPEDKLSVTFAANNPFQRFQYWGSEINDPDFYQRTENYIVRQSFNLSVSYNFGKLKGGIARKKRGIKNDDVNTGGGTGGN